ncbi:MAG: GNAT family N-acetyltransferase [Rhizobium sp.]
MAIGIREAVVEDLPDIARVVVDCWRSTFADLLPTEFLEGMSADHQERRHRRYFGRAGVTYHVACGDNDRVVGFANGGPSRDTGFPHEGELYALYLLAAYQRRGIGTSLFSRVAVNLEGAGCKGMLTFALAANPNRVFYERLGGRQATAEPITLGGMEVAQMAYLWDDVSALMRDLRCLTG